MAEIRRISDGEGETVAALWDEQNRTGIDGAPLSQPASSPAHSERWTPTSSAATRPTPSLRVSKS